ncbi:MAG TPA: hypothetical protein VFG79_13940 [Solirubrobacter sp.]|jgi:hypothetical protein|nr:hypothetical protein [Solirubrobacter sp.]
MRWFWSFAYRFDILRVGLAVALFVVALASGFGLKSLLVLAVGAFWLLVARSGRRRADAARRHHELRRRRRARMRDGTWLGPYHDD